MSVKMKSEPHLLKPTDLLKVNDTQHPVCFEKWEAQKAVTWLAWVGRVQSLLRPAVSFP